MLRCIRAQLPLVALAVLNDGGRQQRRTACMCVLLLSR